MPSRRPMHDTRLMVLAFGLLACQPPSLRHDGLHSHPSVEDLWTRGVHARFDLYFRREPQGHAPLYCSIKSPSGSAVNCAVEPWWHPASADPPEDVVDIEFKTVEVGWHELEASIDGHSFEAGFYVMEPHDTVVTTLDRACAWVEPFNDGAWLCDGVVLREGEAPQPLPFERAASVGDAIWTFGDGKLGRVPAPRLGAVVSPPDQPLDTGLHDVRWLIASSTDVLVIHPGGVLWGELDARGAPVERARLDRVISESAVVRRVGEFLLIGETLQPWLPGSDATEAAPQTSSDVCAFSLSGSAIAELGCRRYAGTVLGESEVGVLLEGPLEIRSIDATLDDGLSLELPPSLTLRIRSVRRGLAVLPQNVVPRFRDGALRLEGFGDRFPTSLTVASDRFVWRARASSTVVMSR